MINKPRNVLLVTGFGDNIAELTGKLPAEYQVMAAPDPEQAWLVMESISIGLIICMAGEQHQTGWEHCRRLKAHPLSAHIPLLLVTASDNADARVGSLQAGADGHMGGPLQPDHLEVQVRNLLMNRSKVKQYIYRQLMQDMQAREDAQRDQLLAKLSDCLSNPSAGNELNVDILAKLMHMSRPTLYRKIKHVTELTPNVLINETRLKRAAELLTNGDYKIQEVARMVGYASQSSFGKSFLKQFKVTPATYRRMKKLMDAA